MQTPGRRVEPQTSMLPLERRMDGLERRLVSLSGKVVRTYNGTGEARLDMGNLPLGMYVLQYAPAMGRVQVQRVMVQ